MSRSNRVSLHVQRSSLDRIERQVTTEKEINDFAWKRTGEVYYAKRFFNSLGPSHLRALLGEKRLYTFHDDKFMKGNAVRQFQFTALSLTLVFALLRPQVSEPLHIQ